MTASDRKAVMAAMRLPLLLDRGSGVYWDFDFKKKEFRVGTACNTGLLVDFTVKYGEPMYADVMAWSDTRHRSLDVPHSYRVSLDLCPPGKTDASEWSK